MSFLDTEPAAIHCLDATSTWEQFRVEDPRRLLAVLREVCCGAVPLTLGIAGGRTAVAVLWSVDEAHARLVLSVAPDVAGFRDLSATSAPWAAGYLENVKVQFELHSFTVETQGPTCMVHADIPRQLFSLPRRQTVRVRHAELLAPVVLFRHPPASDVLVSMRVLDISMTGCAVWNPISDPPLWPGTEIRQVEVQLDDMSIFVTDLHVEHVTFSAVSLAGSRVGCAWKGMPQSGCETLQHWISRGRRRRGLVSFTFD